MVLAKSQNLLPLPRRTVKTGIPEPFCWPSLVVPQAQKTHAPF